MVVLLGDFNAKVGRDVSSWKGIIGSHSLYDHTCTNGERLLDLCASRDLCIGGTLFPHKDIYKYTWTAPNSKYKNQIDHICISRTWRKSLLDVRTKRSADIGSDHELVLAKIQIRLAAHARTKPMKKKFFVQRLSDPGTSILYQTEIANRFAALSERSVPMDQESLDKRWDEVKTVILEAAEVTVGKKPKPKDCWITNETKALMEKRGRQGALHKDRTFHKLVKEVKKAVTADKNKWVEAQADAMEAASNKNDIGGVYRIVRKLTGKHKRRPANVKDDEGNLITNTTAKQTQWKDYFEKLLNNVITDPNQRNKLLNSSVRFPRLDVNEEPPTTTEILSAIKKLKNGKSPGLDNINAELLKHGNLELAEELRTIYECTWSQGIIPSEWKKGVITIVPKSGDLSKCSNNRGITLLPLALKVLNRIIINRIEPSINKILRENQAGFRKGRSCREQIHCIRLLIEKSKEYRHPLYTCFVDYKAAFDSVDQDLLWESLERYGVPPVYINILRESYRGFEACVNVDGSLTEWFLVLAGVKQGDVISPLLFNIMIDWILRSSVDDIKEEGVKVIPRKSSRYPASYVTDREFADDLAATSTTPQGLQKLITAISTTSAAANLKMNVTKTKVMYDDLYCPNHVFTLDGNPLDRVEEYKYLGSYITKDNNIDRDIDIRIGKALGSYNGLESIWRDKKISATTKMKIYRCSVRSTLTYACETWPLTQKQERRLSVCDRRLIRKTLGVRWFRRMTNVELHKIAAIEPLEYYIRRMRLRWTGHVYRLQEITPARAILKYQPKPVRPIGHPTNRFQDTLKLDCSRAGPDYRLQNIETVAADRTQWRKFVRAATGDG